VRFGGKHAIGEQLDLARGARVETIEDTGFNGVDGGIRSVRAACGLLQTGAGGADGGGRGSVIGDLAGLLADLARLAGRGLAAREGDGPCEQIAVNSQVDDAFGQCAFRADMLA